MKKSIFLFGLLLIATTMFAQTWQTNSYGLYLNPNTANLGIGNSAMTNAKLYLYQGDNTATGTLYGLYSTVSNYSNETDTYGEYLNVRNYNANNYEDVYGSYIVANNNANAMGHIVGVRVNVSGGLYPSRRYSGYFTGGHFIVTGGNIGIGTLNPTVPLDVIGTIRATEVKVCLNQGCDFVFDKGYNLMPLNDLSTFISENKHLPEIAPAAEMESNGINLSEMNAKLLQKVEELTLYLINLQQQIDELKK